MAEAKKIGPFSNALRLLVFISLLFSGSGSALLSAFILVPILTLTILTAKAAAQVSTEASPAGDIRLHTVAHQFIPETGSPVEISSAKTELEIDAFEAPVAARIGIDYKNVSIQPVAAVKFRVGYFDKDGKPRGIFHAPDGKLVQPGASAANKWRGKVDPRTTSMKIRVLTVKFADGNVWESEKMKEMPKSSPGADADTSNP